MCCAGRNCSCEYNERSRSGEGEGWRGGLVLEMMEHVVMFNGNETTVIQNKLYASPVVLLLAATHPNNFTLNTALILVLRKRAVTSSRLLRKNCKILSQERTHILP